MTMLVTDPVCLDEVGALRTIGGNANYRGNTYYFCSLACRRSFEREPEKYAHAVGEHAVLFVDSSVVRGSQSRGRTP